MILLPLALLARRDTRRAGVLSLAAVAGFSMCGLIFLASRARDVQVLSPFTSYENFQAKGTHWVFSQENFSPRGLLCRLATRTDEPLLTRGVATLAVLILILVANRVLADRPGTSWEVFGLACLLSPMVGPVAWAHYQIVELPLLVLLMCQFLETKAPWWWWALLAGAYVLSDLLLRPLDDSVPGALLRLATGQHETPADMWAVMAVSQFGQYILCGTALAWFGSRRFSGREA